MSQLDRETDELTLQKFHNDLEVWRRYLQAASKKPSIASVPMPALLPVKDRLLLPGEAERLAWISGDFSVKGQAYGIEIPSLGIYKWAYIDHHPDTIPWLRLALKGNAAAKSNTIVLWHRHCESVSVEPGAYHLLEI